MSRASTPCPLFSLFAGFALNFFVIVQERNSLGAVKAVTAAQLAMASDTVYRVSLDQAIEAMRLTAADMSVKYKETSLSVRLSRYFLRGLYPSLSYPIVLLTDNSFCSIPGFGGKSHGSVYPSVSPQLFFVF